MKARRGFTLVEALIAGLIMTVIGAGIWTLIRSSYNSQYMLMAQNQANTENRSAIDQFLDELRGATGVTAAAASDITFTMPSGASVRYRKNGSLFQRTVSGGGGGATTSTVVDDMSALSMTYTTYNASTGAWATSSSPSSPGLVVAVNVNSTVSVNGYSRQIRCTVRIRRKRTE